MINFKNTIMIRKKIHIDVGGKRWNIEVFLPISKCNVQEIIQSLVSIGIDKENLSTAYSNLSSGRVNNGITFTNPFYREAVVVIAMSMNQQEYFNLICHELHHLSVHIALASGYDLEGEEVCYINGDIAGMLYPTIKHLVT